MQHMLKPLPHEDLDNDGVPDSLNTMLQDHGFGLSNDKWHNRRTAVFWTLLVTGGSCVLMVIIWAWKILFTTTDIPVNLLQFGSAIFYAMSALFTTVLLGYLGFSQADTNTYRKHAVDLAKAVPTGSSDSNNGGYGGYGGRSYNRGGGYGGYDYGVPGASSDATQEDMSLPPVPPTPIGPTERKNVIL